MAITLNDNIYVAGNKPVEDKYLNNGVVWANTALVLSTIPISERYLGLTVLVGTSEYWFKNDTSTLVLKNNGTIVVYSTATIIQANTYVVVVSPNTKYYTYYCPTTYTSVTAIADTNAGNLIYQAGYKDTFLLTETYYKGQLLYDSLNTYECINSYTNNGTNTIAEDLTAGNWKLLNPEFIQKYVSPLFEGTDGYSLVNANWDNGFAYLKFGFKDQQAYDNIYDYKCIVSYNAINLQGTWVRNRRYYKTIQPIATATISLASTGTSGNTITFLEATTMLESIPLFYILTNNSGSTYTTASITIRANGSNQISSGVMTLVNTQSLTLPAVAAAGTVDQITGNYDVNVLATDGTKTIDVTVLGYIL